MLQGEKIVDDRNLQDTMKQEENDGVVSSAGENGCQENAATGAEAAAAPDIAVTAPKKKRKKLYLPA